MTVKKAKVEKTVYVDAFEWVLDQDQIDVIAASLAIAYRLAPQQIKEMLHLEKEAAVDFIKSIQTQLLDELITTKVVDDDIYLPYPEEPEPQNLNN